MSISNSQNSNNRNESDSYSYLAILFLMFLVTDLAKYKPLIVLEWFAYILTWVLLLWGHSLAAMQTMQVFYASVSGKMICFY